MDLTRSQLEMLRAYREEVARELSHNILPFYICQVLDEDQGGFYGRITNDMTVQREAPKGQVQHSRLLWTFAHAYRRLRQSDYRQMADRTFAYLLDHFWDDELGGLYWMVDFRGRPLQTTKLVYGQAFGIYGFSEYYLATGERQGLETAVSLYHLLQEHTVDAEYGGYFEACDRDWTLRHDINVDYMVEPVIKTMNTHLHLVEAYTSLLQAWPNDALRASLHRLIRLTIDCIVNSETGHLQLHFTRDWQPMNSRISHGHDIEGSWLLVEAAQVLDDPALRQEVQTVALQLARATYDEGIDQDGGLVDDGSEAKATAGKDWWPQAEAMVGFFNAYQLTGRSRFLQASLNSWRFVQAHLIDRQHGDWFWGISSDGSLQPREKAGPWKTPYHNGRACLEIMRRIDSIVGGKEGNIAK